MLSRSLFTRPLLRQSRAMASSTPELIHFGPYEVTDQVFYNSSSCYGLVNIKPILPGHTLVIPYRRVSRLTDLSASEVADLFTTVQKVQRMLARHFFQEDGSVGKPEHGSFNIAVQDGELSGQTVPHVHCHIIPRTKKEPRNLETDQIYDLLQGEEGNVGGGLWDVSRPKQAGKFPAIEDSEREPRSADEMNREAKFFREQMTLLENESEEE